VPLPTDIPTAALEGVIKLIERGFQQALDVLIEDFFELLKQLWDAFPNVFTMLDLMAQFSTGLLGRLITVPFAGVEGYLLDLMRLYKVNNRVMTAEAFVKAVVRAQSEVVTNLTGTSSNSIQSAVLQGLARWTWALWKRFEFIQALTRIRSYEDLLRIYTSKVTSRARFYGVVLFVVAIFASIAWTGAIAILIGCSLSIVTGDFQKFLLPQDSKRVWRRTGAVHRQNRRRGPD